MLMRDQYIAFWLVVFLSVKYVFFDTKMQRFIAGNSTTFPNTAEEKKTAWTEIKLTFITTTAFSTQDIQVLPLPFRQVDMVRRKSNSQI